MELHLRLFQSTPQMTISQLYLGDFKKVKPECFILERPLGTGTNRRDDPKTAAINESEAIPEGRFPITLNYSPGFKQLMFQIIVPGRDGIRIHIANQADQLLGCLAPGTAVNTAGVLNSTAAYISLVNKLSQLILSKEDLWLNVSRKK